MVEVEGAKERAERAKKLLALKPADRIGLEREMTRQFPALVADVLALLAEQERLRNDRDVLAEGVDMWRSRALLAEKRYEIAYSPAPQCRPDNTTP